MPKAARQLHTQQIIVQREEVDRQLPHCQRAKDAGSWESRHYMFPYTSKKVNTHTHIYVQRPFGNYIPPSLSKVISTPSSDKPILMPYSAIFTFFFALFCKHFKPLNFHSPLTFSPLFLVLFSPFPPWASSPSGRPNTICSIGHSIFLMKRMFLTLQPLFAKQRLLGHKETVVVFLVTRAASPLF